MTFISKSNIFSINKNCYLMKKRKTEWRVVLWHNDYPDGSKSNGFYGRGGPIYERVEGLIARSASLKWHFHGGFIHPGRTNLLRRLEKADVIICGTASNMDLANDTMYWDAAEDSLFRLLQEIKTENKELKIFFLNEPHHLKDDFASIGEIMSDPHDARLYEYFRHR